MRKEELAYQLGYRISEDGIDITGIRRTKLKGWIDKHGYRQFRVGKKICNVLVSRLQAYQKYKDKIYEDGIEVRHKNGIPLDNSIENILIGTAIDNYSAKSPENKIKAAIAGGLATRKLTEEECIQLRLDRINGATYKELIQKYSLSKSTISYIVNNKTYK